MFESCPTDPSLVNTQGDADEGRFNWSLGLDFEVAVVTGLDERAALHAVAPDSPVEAVRVARLRADSLLDQGAFATVLRAHSQGESTILTMLDGVSLRSSEVAARLSQHGRSVIFGRDMTGHNHFYVAQHGAVVRAFEPLLYRHEPGFGIGARLPEEDGLSFGIDACSSASLVLIERLTGLSLRREAIVGTDERHLAVAVPVPI